MRRFIKHALALVLTLALTQAACAQTLYETGTTVAVSRGLSYEHSERVTTNGLLDVHTLTVDLGQEHLTIKPLASQKEHGLKETLSQLVTANGAIAGINGDFFGMSGGYSAPLGLEIIDGKVTNASEGFNSNAMESATFFISETGSPFMGYVKTQLKFLNNGAESIDLFAYNRVTDAVLPFYIDRSAYASTAQLDARFPGLYKIVVQAGLITYISTAGETVDVPENGYVVVISANTATYHLSKFAAGQRAEVQLTSGIDLAKMQAAISGGSKILTNGAYTEEGYYVTGRHPRTAIGISADRSKLILMVVDGRGESIGATHGELAALLREYGAHDAMHLDGGGSSTLAVNDTAVAVKNRPSDGAERKVVNGLGVFNNSVMSDIEALQIETQGFVFDGVPSKLRVYGLDKYLNKAELTDGVVINAFDGDGAAAGYYADGYFHPTAKGTLIITAAYGGLSAAKTVKSGELVQITPKAQDIRMAVGGEYIFGLTGKSDESFVTDLDTRGLSVEAVPAELAVFTGDKLIGTAAGAGYVKLTVGGVDSYVRLVVGTRDTVIDTFDTPRGVSYLSYPEGIAGQVAWSGAAETGTALELRYQMGESSSTQAAYAVFDPPIAIAGQPSGIKLSVYGDNSNNWLRGRVTDANGTAHTIDFARHIDWTGYKTVEARIPTGAAYPVTLDRIYVAATESLGDEPRSVYLDNLTAVYPIEAAEVTLPESEAYADRKLTELAAEERAFTDIMLIGDITSALPISGYTDIQNKYKTEFNTRYGETYGLFLVLSDNIAANMPVFKWTAKYDSYKLGGASIINLVATNGNMYSSNTEQWQRLRNDLSAAGKNVLIIIDRNPQTTLPKKELSLLHELLVASGKNIIVASAEGHAATATVTDGVRYINLGGLFTSEGGINADFKTLRVRFYEDDIRYSLK